MGFLKKKGLDLTFSIANFWLRYTIVEIYFANSMSIVYDTTNKFHF